MSCFPNCRRCPSQLNFLSPLIKKWKGRSQIQLAHRSPRQQTVPISATDVLKYCTFPDKFECHIVVFFLFFLKECSSGDFTRTKAAAQLVPECHTFWCPPLALARGLVEMLLQWVAAYFQLRGGYFSFFFFFSTARLCLITFVAVSKVAIAAAQGHEISDACQIVTAP